MKLILNEKQYDRLFSSKKRKLVITESQYNKLLFESESVNSLLNVGKSDAIKLVSGKNVLHFKVVSKNGNEFMMINCNDGVYKNAYFHIKGNSLTKNSLTYTIAQNSAIDSNNPWETIGSDVWRKSTFKNLSTFDVYNDSGEGLTCNLSDSSKKKFGIDMDTGAVIDDGSDKEDEEELSDDETFKQVIDLFKDVEPGNKYKITIGTYVDNEKRNKGINREIGAILINVVEVSAKYIFFEVLETEGEAKEYDDLLDKDLTFVKDGKNIKIKSEGKADFKLFDIKIEAREGKTDDGGSLVKKNDVIADIMDFKLIGPYDSEEKEKESEDIEAQLTDDEQDKLVKKLVTNNKFLQNAIASKPNKVLELLGLARKKGTLPIKGRMDKWYNSVTDKALEQKNFPINKIFTARLADEGSFNFKDKSNSSGINFNSDVKVKSLKPNSNDNKIRFGTNFTQTVKQEETYKYNITLIKQIKEDEKFYIYEVKVYYNSNEKSSSEYVGEGKLKIIKDVKK